MCKTTLGAKQWQQIAVDAINKIQGQAKGRSNLLYDYGSKNLFLIWRDYVIRIKLHSFS